MSYDVDFSIDTGAGRAAEVASHNYTYNCGPMFYKALEGGINSLHNMSARDAIPLLQRAVTYMTDHPDELRALNPPNGWGNYEGATSFLAALLASATDHPATTITVT